MGVAVLYVLLDSNIFIRVGSQGKPGCEIEHLRELGSMAEKKALRLLFPEVVKLEIEKHWQSFPQDLGNNVGGIRDRLSQALDKPPIWSELEDLRAALVQFLDTWKGDKRRDCEARHKEIQALVSKHAEAIPLTYDIFLNAKRRQIAGKKPEPNNRADQDALIVESLCSFFRTCRDKEATLFFCSENTRDFALEIDEKGRYTLHPTIKDDLPESAFFTSLEPLVSYARKHKPPPPPAREEVEAALKRERERKLELSAMSEALRSMGFFQESNALSEALRSMGVFQESNALSEALRHVRSFVSPRREPPPATKQIPQAGQEGSTPDASLEGQQPMKLPDEHTK